jgi:hypothetical protein
MSKRPRKRGKAPPPPEQPFPLGSIAAVVLGTGVMIGGWALLHLAGRSTLGGIVVLLGAAIASYGIQYLLRRVDRLREQVATRKLLAVLGAVALSVPCTAIVILYGEAEDPEVTAQLDVVSLQLTLDQRHNPKKAPGPSDLEIAVGVKNTSPQPQPPLTARITLLDRKGQRVLQAEGPVGRGTALAPGASAQLRLSARLPAAAFTVSRIVTMASTVSARFVFHPRGKPQLQITHTQSWGTRFILGSDKVRGGFFLIEP